MGRLGRRRRLHGISFSVDHSRDRGARGGWRTAACRSRLHLNEPFATNRSGPRPDWRAWSAGSGGPLPRYARSDHAGAGRLSLTTVACAKVTRRSVRVFTLAYSIRLLDAAARRRALAVPIAGVRSSITVPRGFRHRNRQVERLIRSVISPSGSFATENWRRRLSGTDASAARRHALVLLRVVQPR